MSFMHQIKNLFALTYGSGDIQFLFKTFFITNNIFSKIFEWINLESRMNYSAYR